MANCLEDNEVKCLIEDITVLLTGGVWDIELKEKHWCSLLRLAVQDFYFFIEQWIIENKYGNFYAKELSAADICQALTTSSIDLEIIQSQSFSEQIGILSRGGRYELKKDYIDLVDGVQVYTIPSGREVKKVFFSTPSNIDYAKMAGWGFGNMGLSQYGGFGGVVAGVGVGASYGAVYPLFPAHDVLLRAAHFNLVDRLFNSVLTYKITKGANGTRLLHLFSVPTPTGGLRKELYSCRVWYDYYDVSGMSDDDRALCAADCKAIYSPHMIDLPKQDFCDLNNWGKTYVRKWLTALAKESIGRARGKYKGKVIIPNGETLELDWDSFLSESKDEIKELKDGIVEFLVSLRSDKQIERKAGETENLMKVLSSVPMKISVI